VAAAASATITAGTAAVAAVQTGDKNLIIIN